MALQSRVRWIVTASALAALTIGMSPGSRDVSAKTRYIGSDHIVSWETLPDQTGQMCLWPEDSSYQTRGGAAFAPAPGGAPAQASSVPSFSKPDRVIRDRYPSFSSIAVDLARDQVVVTDENLFQVMFFNRTENNAPNQVATPLRVIGTKWDESLMSREESKTKIEFQCGLYIDPRNGDVYAVNNDTQDTLVIFSNEQVGNVRPTARSTRRTAPSASRSTRPRRRCSSPSSTTAPSSSTSKGASGEEPPFRLLQGNRTRLADPHGVAFDPRRGLLFVTNHGSVHESRVDSADFLTPAERAERAKLVNFPLDRDFAVPGSGRTLPPAITVYAKNATGDTAPLRVIEGPRTGLNWPTGIAVDAERGEVYVTNDTTDSILVFDAEASGNVAPKRMLKGAEDRLEESHRPRAGSQEQRAVGGELWRPHRHRLSPERVRRRGAAAHDPRRDRGHALADDRQPGCRRFRYEAG